MTVEIRKKLEDLGYQRLTAKPEEAVVYYRNEKNRIHAVITVDYHNGFILDPAQVQKMQEKMKLVFENPGKYIPGFKKNDYVYSVDILLLLLAEHMEGIREICAANKNVWAVDINSGKFYIYENQPGDFYNLKNIIDKETEQILQKEDKSKESIPKGSKLKESKSKEKKGTFAYRANGKSRAWVTTSLVVFNIIVWAVLEIMGDTNDAFFMELHGAMQPAVVLANGEWWRLFTSMFLHFGQEHLINNMLMLFLLGSRLEEQGKLRYFCIYLLTGLAGNILSLWGMLRTADMAVAAGASGCVYGVIGALAAVVVLNRGKFKGLTTRGLIFMIVLSLYYGFSTAGVDNWAHVGGLVSGMVFGVIFYWGKRRKD